MLCGASGGKTPRDCQIDRVVLRITDCDVKEAISLSVALKRPGRSFGAIIASRASSFTEGSARVYISVVCMCAWPSHRETFRGSLVGQRQFEIRAEAFNLTNTPSFNLPGSLNFLDARNFASITSMRNAPRQIQLGAKIHW
jgi:hypothetical protein